MDFLDRDLSGERPHIAFSARGAGTSCTEFALVLATMLHDCEPAWILGCYRGAEVPRGRSGRLARAFGDYIQHRVWYHFVWRKADFPSRNRSDIDIDSGSLAAHPRALY